MCFKKGKLIKPLRKWGDDYIFTMGNFDFMCDKYDLTFLSNGQLYSAKMTWGEYNSREENYELSKFILKNQNKIEEKYNINIELLYLTEGNVYGILNSVNFIQYICNYGIVWDFNKVDIKISLPQFKEKYEKEYIEKTAHDIDERVKRKAKFQKELNNILE